MPTENKYLSEAEAAVLKETRWRDQHFGLYRALEIFPGALVWSTIIGLTIMAFVRPTWLATLMLIYVTLWLLRALRFTSFLIRAYIPFVRSMKTDWQAKIEAVPELNERSKKIRHVILAATYKEEYETLARALEILSKTTFPKEQIIFVLATEERDHENAQSNAKRLQQKFGAEFGDFMITEHPAAIPGEIKGKGTNISWAGRVIRDYCQEHRFDLDYTLVTSIDADHRLHPSYLSILSYEFLTDPKPQVSSYVSVAAFFNNIWDVPSPVRFIHFSSTFWMMATSVWTSRLHNVMTQTQTLSALIKTDFYPPTSIVEDGQQYWRSLFTLGDNYDVKMLLMPVFGDAVLTDTWWGTIKEQYLQRRRWNYGISDFPYATTHFLLEPKHRTLRVFIDICRHLEGHFGLATMSLLLGVIGWIPILLSDINHTVLGLNFQNYYSLVLRFSLVGIVLSAIFSVALIPPKYEGKWWSKLLVLWDFILLPIQIPLSILLATSVPSLDSHTRLMFGRYLGFRVTPKAVSTKTTLTDT